MKKYVKKLTSAAMAFAILCSTYTLDVAVTHASASEAKIQAQFYVAVNGNDSNDGSQSRPFATLDRAKKAVAAMNGNMIGNIIVNIGAGDYFLDNTMEFNEKDSGSNGYEVIYRSADGVGAANFIGGDEITGWTLATEADVTGFDLDRSLLGKVYKVQLDKGKYDFNTLYVNDQRAVMARTRNRDNNPNFPMAKGEYVRSTGGDNKNFNMKYKAGDLDQKAITGMMNAQARGEKEIAQVFVWDGGDWDWFTNTVPIQTINASANEFKFPRDPNYPEKYRTKYNIGTGARYFLQGNLAFMDVEGEYHYNKATGVLYYYPKAGDGNIANQTIIVPTMQQVLRFKGADKLNDGKVDLAAVPDPQKQVHNITIDGLGIKDTEFADYYSYSWNWGDAGAGIGYHPKESTGSTNPSYSESTERPEFRVGSVTLTDANHITIINTRVKNAGMYGIVFAGDNQYNRLENSVVENTGNGGIMFDGGYPGIGKYNNHNIINNVLIHNVGEQVGHAVGFTLLSSGQNEIAHLEIFNTPKRAILVLGGYRRDGNGADKNYDEIKDMYTVGNHLKDVYVHDAQQDAGEDSAVFLSWLLSGKDVNRLHGSNDPNKLTTNLGGIDTAMDRYNYLDQFIIANIGADPSVIEKCTAGGLDTAMGATGTNLTHIKGVNTQAHSLAIRPGSYGDMYITNNTTSNIGEYDVLKTFDDSKLDYNNIGLTATFPSELRVSKRTYPTPPENIYFGDDFEASNKLNTKKWTVEKGKVDMYFGNVFMSEDPLVGKRSLPINADANPGGVVVSRTFENSLNKIVEVKYMDRRKDYAYCDRTEATGPNEIMPNSFIRVDDGVNALGLGAVGSVSKDYYQIKKGNQLIQTNVRRAFGWHTFKFDYTSGTDVKLYIDDQVVGTFAAASFSYIGMGDWEGTGGKAFFDQLYVYGGKEAPPVEDLPTAPPPVELTKDIFSENFEGAAPTVFSRNKNKATVEVITEPGNASNKVMHVKSPDDLVYLATSEVWSNYTFESKVKIDNFNVSAQRQPWDNFAPVWYAKDSGDNNHNFNRYSLKYRIASKDFTLYRRSGGDTDMIAKPAPADFVGTWHDYKITTMNGVITAYIDGNKIFEYTDTANKGGTIGFDGINAEYYVDDIKVTRQKTANPSADKESGKYATSLNIKLTPALNDQSIYYTIDGSDPRTKGQLYDNDEGLTISKSTTLKIAAIGEGMLYSDVVEYTYTFENDQQEAFTLSLNQPSYSLAIGDTHQSVVTATYKDSGTVKDVTSLAVFATADGNISAVDHKGVVTGITEGSTTISASYGGETVTAQVHVTKRDAQQTAVQMTGPASVLKGDSFAVRLGLKQVQEPIFAQDMMIQYDPKLYEFKDEVAMRDGLTVYTQPSSTPGQIRLIIASLGADHAIATDADVVELKFAAKQVAQSASGAIAVTSATIGDAEGKERQALPASVTVEVTAVPALPGDVNQDGKYSIADLAMAAAHYGMTQQHPDWSKFKTADVDGNGVIDIVDLAAIAKKIIEA
ncbi:chitobiase/beta-hexosaminidase C-terminal domain-containing protein [Paenibacillus guangzhouensis]|uniref:chitobiase/beta-hexosaminidase C-terminal domain-containing protein n=1 Tax=Paenibacillus guangzhouensis TaxID=1473112 RepID=UPI001266B0A9|nr:cohesin domain-containing protein [Paenibacillus guangzhouensis]